MKKTVYAIIAISTVFLANINYSQCTNGTVMCTSLSASADTLCNPGNVTITVDDGTLGAGSEWELYTGSCGGTLVATTATNSFTNISVSSTTTFFIKADSCNNSSCISIDIVLATSSNDPISITTSDTIVCQNNNVILDVVGGSLGTGAQWNWYDDVCGGNLVGQSSTLNVNPTSTTTYSVRAEGYCNNTLCEDITIQTYPHYIDLDSIRLDSVFNPSDTSWYIPDTICPQTAVKLFAHYSGTLPNGYSITWYENSCGSTPIGVGDSLEVMPNNTTCLLYTSDAADDL